ncbi:OLC1v1031389C1 [Oldenlandia corymbosa var. corymbosa]|uniref:OLC1v1031389C1 n=1 Tax=Oldenlandia corymbosa var. corymbosa TaxID=529605 RepID=A0AAV1CJ59_OLDCO|nr:OLC1v1031389C1 [Oldenlandia corymbosa var. corymbosa]
MKLSIKTQDPHHQHNHHHNQPQPPAPPQNNQNLPLLFRAKIPISIFNLPFISGFSTTTHHPSDLSLSLSTNFSSGPTLKLSYSTATTSSAAATNATTAAAVIPSASSPPPPLTLTLKSGIGQFGSPKDSPLVISANFSYNPHLPNSNPTFSLLFKPQLGSFCLKKSTFSHSPGSPSGKINGDGVNSFGFIPLERPLSLKDFSMETNGKDSILRGFSVMAKTDMPVGKRVLMSLRWGVNFPEDLSKQVPYLTVNKIGIKRIDEVKPVKEVKEKKSETNSGDSEMLKGMCLWMKRELDMLQKENREMKHRLDEMKLGHFGRGGGGGGGVTEIYAKKLRPAAEDSNGFEWRSNKNRGEDSSKKEMRKNGDKVSDVESELQRAIRAASSP